MAFVGKGSSRMTDVLDRFFNKVQKTDSCWLWTGSIEANGYGRFRAPNKVSAHRFSYETFVGHISSGLVIDHLCRVRNCVNPEHLEAVTHLENVRRGNSGLNQKLKTHCPQNHEYNEVNTYFAVRSNGNKSRHCRVCNRNRAKIV
jgi:HNH endonuclease